MLISRLHFITKKRSNFAIKKRWNNGVYNICRKPDLSNKPQFLSFAVKLLLRSDPPGRLFKRGYVNIGRFYGNPGRVDD